MSAAQHLHPALPTTRRATARAARDNAPPMGVYAIRVTASGHTVVHASANLEAAMNRDRFELRLGSHRDRRLQAAWRAGGAAALVFEVLEVIRPKPEPAFDAPAALALALHLWRDELLGDGATPATPTAPGAAP